MVSVKNQPLFSALWNTCSEQFRKILRRIPMTVSSFNQLADAQASSIIKLDQCYFPMNFRNISEQLLFRKPQGGCSCRSIKWSRFWFICRIARTKFTSENMSWITIQFHFFESLNNWYLIIFHCFSFGWVPAAFKHECNTEIALPLSLEFFWHYAIATAPTF